MAKPHSVAQSQIDVRHALWQREMRRLVVLSRLLGAVLLALGARILIVGPNLTTELTTAAIVTLLIAAIVLARCGRRHPPAPPPSDSMPRGGGALRPAGPDARPWSARRAFPAAHGADEDRR